MPDPRPLRSLLFVPGGRTEMVVKAYRSAADGVVIDLEDGVLPAGKDTARAGVLEALRTLEPPAGTIVLVRVNAPGSPWHDADVAAVAGTRAHGVVLPKTETAEQIARLRAVLDSRGRGDAVVLAGLETALGVADARSTLAGSARAGVIGAYFGAEDYVADLGGRRTAGGTEVLYARSQVALAARLAGLPALDQVVLAVHDSEGFITDAEIGRSLGYQGKMCIHPAQVALAAQVFTPSPGEIAHARAVVTAARDGGGVAVVDGEMVDDVHVRMARDVLARAGRSAGEGNG